LKRFNALNLSLSYGFIRSALELVQQIEEYFDRVDHFLDQVEKGELGGDTARSLVADSLRRMDAIAEHELNSKVCYVIDDSDEVYLDRERFDGEPLAKFPESKTNLIEAQECLALGKYAASVYYSMCALELVWPSIEELARKTGVDLVVGELSLGKTWNQAITKLEAAIRKIEDSPRSTRDNDGLKLLSGVASHMRSVKNAWRNDTMHARGTHFEEEARDVFEQTRLFLNHLASNS
jgi:polyhydroxyalkanoate synthesis regulator phasin